MPRSTRRARSVLLGLLAGLLLAPPLAPLASAGTSPTPAPLPSGAARSPGSSGAPRASFGLGPATATGRVDGRPYFTFAASPGARLQDHVAVVNITDKPLDLQVYPVSVSNDDRGDFAFADAAAPRTDAGSWLTLGVPGGGDHLRVPARTTAVLPIDLRLPADASPGDHSAGVVADLTTLVRSGSPTGVATTLHQRVGLRVFVRVAGPVRPGLAVSDLKARYEGRLDPTTPGQVVVDYTVRNVGNVNLGGIQQVQVKGLLGTRSAAPAPPAIPLLLPGGSLRVHVVVPRVWPELRERVTATVTPQHLPGDVDPGLSRATASTTIWAVPWTALGILALLLLAALLVRRWRRRRRARAAGRHRSGAPSGAPAAAPAGPPAAEERVPAVAGSPSSSPAEVRP